MPNWESFLLMLVLFVINNLIVIWGYKNHQKRKYEKFLHAVIVEYPNSKLTFIVVEASSEEAITKLEQQIRENRYVHPT